MVRPLELLCIHRPRGAVLGLVVALGACGRVTLGSMVSDEEGSDPRGGAAGSESGRVGGVGGADAVATPSRGGSAAAGSAAGGEGGDEGAQAGSTSGLGAANGLAGSGAGQGTGGTAGHSRTSDDAGSGGSASEAGALGELPDAGADAEPSPPRLPPSCRESNPQCGIATSRASCCESLPVTGGLFELQPDGTGATVPVTVSSFRLDRFEVTVGRMREFIEHYDEWRDEGQPEQDLGDHPLIPGSGWQVPRFSDALPASAEEFGERLRDCGPTPFSTYAEAPSDQVPLNCASWFEAAAFCAWDGGRLPTLRELAYAAVGGAEQRLYPWGNAPEPSRVTALFGCSINTFDPVCTIAEVTPVGARPAGAGLFGHDDLSGSMSEWVLDVGASLDRPCVDCADLGPGEAQRRWRDGNWLTDAETMKNGTFYSLPPGDRNFFLGLRCARDD
jgi:formylglycine-generating enzyme required for sulfatase activity